MSIGHVCESDEGCQMVMRTHQTVWSCKLLLHSAWSGCLIVISSDDLPCPPFSPVHGSCGCPESHHCPQWEGHRPESTYCRSQPWSELCLVSARVFGWQKKKLHAKHCLTYINVEFIILVHGYHSSLPPGLTQKILISELSFPSFFSPNLVIIIPNLLTISLMIVWIVITIIISHYANIIWNNFFRSVRSSIYPTNDIHDPTSQMIMIWL